MINVRKLNPSDISKLEKIYNQFYKDQFEFPDFFNSFMSSFVVTGENDEIISASGIRVFPEIVMLTDKSIDLRLRKEALLRSLNVSTFIIKEHKLDCLTAFVQDDQWMRHLEKIGFKKTKGQALVLEV